MEKGIGGLLSVSCIAELSSQNHLNVSKFVMFFPPQYLSFLDFLRCYMLIESAMGTFLSVFL